MAQILSHPPNGEFFGSALTTRLISIPSSPDTQVTMANSATNYCLLTGLGPGAISFGGSGVQALSSNILFYSQKFEFPAINHNFTFFAVADSVASNLSVTEWRL